VAGAPGGQLAGLRFAVKDLYDVAGEVTSYGNPDWARSHGVAASTAPVVLALLEAGASLVGKTKTVELAFGLTGENVWHGTPINPNAPDRFPGGSSCGSAAAVAAGEVDFAMGSDTGGSVRIPASYCGVFGFRPSWGAISLAGCCALGPSFDTPGWFAANAAVLARVGGEILPLGKAGAAGPLLQPDDVWANADPKVAALLGGLAVSEEVALMGAWQTLLAREPERAQYGWRHCAAAAERGVVEQLLLSDRFSRTGTREGGEAAAHAVQLEPPPPPPGQPASKSVSDEPSPALLTLLTLRPEMLSASDLEDPSRSSPPMGLPSLPMASQVCRLCSNLWPSMTRRSTIEVVSAGSSPMIQPGAAR
jgi:hypothetical protein